jgi:sulfatase maturation enzyme AslB (radical SAM superfamily)
MNEIAPCKDCPDRHPACHGSCDKYKEWSERYQAQQKHLAENKFRWSILASAARDEVRKNSHKFNKSRGLKGGNQ